MNLKTFSLTIFSAVVTSTLSYAQQDKPAAQPAIPAVVPAPAVQPGAPAPAPVAAAAAAGGPAANAQTNGPYSDQMVIQRYLEEKAKNGNSPLSQTQLNQLGSEYKGSKINFQWTGHEVISMEQTLEQQDTGKGIADEIQIENALQGAGLINNPAKTGDSYALLFFGGARLLNPYSITINPNGSSGTLKTGNTQTAGFLEIDLFARSIFRSGDFDDKYCHDNPGKIHWITKDSGGTNRLWGMLPFGNFFPDYDLKFGYTFAGSSAPTNYNVSTIAQGSDFYLDSSIGLPVFRYNNYAGLKAQGTIEFGGGFTTDKNFLEIHPNAFIGGGLQFALQLVSDSATNGTGTLYLLTRAGMGLVDTPTLTMGTNVVVDALQRPQFDLKWAPSIGATALLKLNQSTSIQLGANAYFTDIPSWNITGAVSIDPTKFFK